MTGARRANGARQPRIGGRGPFGRTMRPVGSEYVGKGGIVMVKVAEWPSVPGSKDNWVPKQRYVYEQAYGVRLPPGRETIVIFCDHDRSNFDPDNLLAVPRRYIARMNSMCEWHDRQTAEAALAAAMVDVRSRDVEQTMLTCNRCGRTFQFDRGPKGNAMPKLCPECREEFKREHGRAR